MRTALAAFLTLALVGLGGPVGAAENRHVLPPANSTFVYLTDWNADKEIYRLHRRYSVLGRNVDGGMIVSAVDIDPAKRDARYIEDIQYVLGKEDCIVHLFTGAHFREGGDCNRSLPTRSWPVKARRNGGANHCKVASARLAPVTVAAGTFETIRIDCRAQAIGMPDLVKASYWYAPALGTMVKSASRAIAPNGKSGTFTEELTEYKLP